MLPVLFFFLLQQDIQPFQCFLILCLQIDIRGIAAELRQFRRVFADGLNCFGYPTLKEAFWANHTPTARKLTCSQCGHKGFCVEIWGGDEK